MKLSRRQFLAGGLVLGAAPALTALLAACQRQAPAAPAPGACAALDLDEGLPGLPDRLPTLAEMDAHADALLAQAPGVIEARVLGASAAGRRIRMLSIGQGPRAVLVVGAPHPNEPVGCATAGRMMEALVRNADARHGLGCRWHFIQAIDPDGIALNEPWFAGPRTAERYLGSFYRPAFRQQPEYTFPLAAEGYAFTASTPENLCWQKALDLTRPQVMCSLHNADIGGAFFLTSRDVPALTASLARIPAAAGVPLNEAGEPFAETAPLGPGVWSFPDLRALVTQVIDRGLPVADFWEAGLSSAQFAEERYGTFSMTCEVPLWVTSGAAPAAGAECSSLGFIEAMQQSNAEARRALAEALPRLRSLVGSREERMLLEALSDTDRSLGRLGPRLQRMARIKEYQGWLPLALQRRILDPGNVEPLPCAITDAFRQMLRLAELRPWALLDRLWRLLEQRAPVGADRRQAALTLAGKLAALERDLPMTPVPIGALVALQQRAILETVRCA